jgi:hypothetical protein
MTPRIAMSKRRTHEAGAIVNLRRQKRLPEIDPAASIIICTRRFRAPANKPSITVRTAKKTNARTAKK